MRTARDRVGGLALGLSVCLLVGGWRAGLLPPSGADAAAASLPPVPADASPAPLGVVPVPPAGEGGWDVLVHADDGTPVRFDPCRPVHWVEGAGPTPPGGQDVVRRAVAELSRRTGLVLVLDGPTDELPAADRPLVQTRYGDRWAPVLVSWSTAAASPGLAGDVAGFAGPLAADDGGPHLVSGRVVLDAEDLAYPGGQVRPFAYYAVLHELGHLVGLAHVDDPGQLMYPVGHIKAYGEGDLRGLAAAGSGPCSARDRR